jgi:hypothetical protein
MSESLIYELFWCEKTPFLMGAPNVSKKRTKEILPRIFGAPLSLA